MLAYGYRVIDVEGVPPALAAVLGVGMLLVIAMLIRALVRFGPKRSEEAKARAAAGKAGRRRQAGLRKRRLALQRKAERRER